MSPEPSFVSAASLVSDSHPQSSTSTLRGPQALAAPPVPAPVNNFQSSLFGSHNLEFSQDEARPSHNIQNFAQLRARLNPGLSNRLNFNFNGSSDHSDNNSGIHMQSPNESPNQSMLLEDNFGQPRACLRRPENRGPQVPASHFRFREETDPVSTGFQRMLEGLNAANHSLQTYAMPLGSHLAEPLDLSGYREISVDYSELQPIDIV